MSSSSPSTDNRPAVRSNQAGLASFLVTMVLMVVITLIVLGFAQIARRNQREALDNQLSTQAFYAAETGVNLVEKLMESQTINSKPSCPGDSTFKQLANTTTQVANTCLTIDNAPTNLRYDDIGTNSTVIPIQPDVIPGYGSGKLTIIWQPKTSAPSDMLTDCPSTKPGKYTVFPQAASWLSTCPYGILRFDMVDFTAGNLSGATPTSYGQHSMTVFAPPAASNTAIVKSPAGSTIPASSTIPVTCDVHQCTATISGVNFDHINYLRMTSLYKDVTVYSIAGKDDAHGQPIPLKSAQVVVDSTGKAADVLRRVQVRLDQTNQLAPSYAIEGTTGICKLSITTGPGAYTDSCPP